MSAVAPITRPLHQLRRREQMLALAWGVARTLAAIVAAFLLACVIDWWIDRRRDTPMIVRLGLIAFQVLVAVTAFVIWIVPPLFHRRSDDDLALFVEERHPGLAHRLISAVQFHRPHANVQWMSNELIGIVTDQARQAAGRIDFTALADHRRLKWAGGLLAGLLAILVLVFLIGSATWSALFARQFLLSREIPRATSIANRTAPVQPAAEPVTIQLAVNGPGPFAGELRLETIDGHHERIQIENEPANGVITMTIPPPSGDFTLQAWIDDGRLKEPATVKLVPRPAVTDLTANIILPAYLGTRPNGTRYEQPVPRGEAVGIEGCGLHVTANTQKPVTRAVIELFGADANRKMAVTRTLPMALANPQSPEAKFELKADETGYRIRVWDEYEFENIDPPRRDVRLVPEEPPVVTLLAEQFRPEGFTGSGEDFEVEGVPVPLGGAIKIGYTATHPYGLGKAVLVYRINEGEWRRLALQEVPETEATGPFDIRRGCFVNSQLSEPVQFHAVPSPNPADRPGRLDGGGRFDFQTRSLPGLKVTDTIEYFVEVSNRHPTEPIAGRSETRSKRVVTVAELIGWIDATLRQEDRIRRLTDRQKGVFDPKAPNP